MPMIDSAAIIGTNARVASGRIGRLNRMNPYVPIFRRTAARMTEPAVGASVCASGSQVWNGNIGTLIAKPEEERQEDPPLQVGVEAVLLELDDVEACAARSAGRCS